MHSLFFSQVNAGVEGNVELPTEYTQPVEKKMLTTVNHNPVVKRVIDIHTDEKDEEIISFDLGKPLPKEEIIHFDIGMPCEECE